MNDTVFLFPGQASQYVGMGRDLYENEPLARAFYDRAAERLPFDLLKLSFEGPSEELTQTRVTQPAIFVHSVIVSQLISPRGLHMSAAAGHSLGEYSALVASGALGFDQALEIVALRGELMQNAGDERPGTMAAILGLEPEVVEELCKKASNGNGIVVAANLNAPGQIAISGDVVAVDRAIELAKEKNARRAMRLNVSGAFHSPLMAPAAEKLAEKVRAAAIRPPNVSIYQNVSAKPTTDPDEIRAGLIAQLTSPVRWIETIRNMSSNGVEMFVEVGPGSVLQGLTKRILPHAQVMSVGDCEQVSAFHAAMG
ncbi:MAG: ACP S-malonyltransferase [bacterium]